jgi:hypothetical protein
VTTPGECVAWGGVVDIPAGPDAMYAPAEWCAYLQLATDILWAATGRRWRGPERVGEAVLRAAPPRAGEPGWPYHRSWGECRCYLGTNILGPTWDLGLGGGHHELGAVRLPHPDVTSIVAVTVDDAPFSSFRLDGAWLARTDGQGWPLCQDRAVVTYRFGRPPPDAGRLAAVQLAVEFGRAACASPDQTCRLPMRLQSVTRQGISFEALDDLQYVQAGLTGLLAVDMWIKSVNPYGRKQPASLWSPDLPRARSI